MANSRSTAARPWRARATDPGQAANGQRHSLGSAHRCAVARHARAIWQLELGVRALQPLEQAWSVGRCIRDVGQSWAASRQGACHRFHHRAGAPACSRRKRGNQNQEALGRSRGGFSTKIHLRTNAQGNPLTFDVTPGEAHEVKGYDALMELYNATSSILGATASASCGSAAAPGAGQLRKRRTRLSHRSTGRSGCDGRRKRGLMPIEPRDAICRRCSRARGYNKAIQKLRDHRVEYIDLTGGSV
jgi:hypothetical protein